MLRCGGAEDVSVKVSHYRVAEALDVGSSIEGAFHHLDTDRWRERDMVCQI